MKESAAWRTIARKLERDGSCYSGLCYEVGVFKWDNNELWTTMGCRVFDHVEAMESPTINEWGTRLLDEPGVVGPRILAAYFLALEAEEEGE